jgi:hypothetical protein
MIAVSKYLRNKLPAGLLGNYRKYKTALFKSFYLKQWEKRGFPIPPPHVAKQNIIKNYAEKFKLKILVETGTYLGDMVTAQRKYFEKIYSIELGMDLWQNANKRFAKYSKIMILQGDSSIVLQNIVSQLNQSALFWLDGHYSGGITAKGNKICPVYEELKAILNSKVDKNIILIDDARLFNGEDDYPKYEELINYIKNFNVDTEIKKEHDIIRIIVTAKKEIPLNK